MTGGRAWSGAVAAAGLGSIAGAFEVAGLASSSGSGFTLAGLLTLGLLDAALLAVAAVIVAVVVRALRGSPAVQLGVVAALLAALFVSRSLGPLVVAGRGGVALGFAVLPVLVGLATYGQARLWLRRAQDGRVRVGWTSIAVAIAAGTIGLTALLGPRDVAAAVRDRPSVLLVTVDGLRAGDPALVGATTFTTAIAPSPSTVATHASLLTGLHPLRHHALDDLRPLPGGVVGIAERFADEGFATAAFVSSAAVVDVGLEPGFARFDDALGPGGVERLALVDLVVGTRFVRRDAADTVSRAVAWLREDHGPSLAWVHLEHDDDTPRQLATLAGAVGADTLVIVVGTTGDRPGVVAHGLGDDRVRVGLQLVVPGRPAQVVDTQVRLLDVGATALAWSGIARPDELEGLDLLGFLDARRTVAADALLVARADDDHHLLGLRQPALKVVLDPATDAVAVFDLEHDPGEAHDLAAEQVATSTSARAALAPDVAALRRLQAEPQLGARHRARLRALGETR